LLKDVPAFGFGKVHRFIERTVCFAGKTHVLWRIYFHALRRIFLCSHQIIIALCRQIFNFSRDSRRGNTGVCPYDLSVFGHGTPCPYGRELSLFRSLEFVICLEFGACDLGFSYVREGLKPSPLIGRYLGTARRAPTFPRCLI